MTTLTGIAYLAQLVLGAAATGAIMPRFDGAELWYLLMPLHWPFYLGGMLLHGLLWGALGFSLVLAQFLLFLGPIPLWCIAWLGAYGLGRWLLPAEGRGGGLTQPVRGTSRRVRTSMARAARRIIVAVIVIPSVVASSLQWHYVDVIHMQEPLIKWTMDLDTRAMPYISIFVVTHVLAMIANVLVGVVMMGLRELSLVEEEVQDGEIEGSVLARILLFSNVGSALLFYIKVYQPEGTYKPPWAENLG
ncbi:hypothetical protein F4778DRAFT_715500 [Xylariomycetidae sp. FL2044]|nr:hypothetical protein F4778DRAFT_715500 [Xylariomycetidae sp. FL2044]